MSSTPTFISTSDNINRHATIAPIITGVCTIACCIAVASATNRVQVEYPQQSLSDVHIISTDIAERKMYNSGNIKLCLDGVSAMDMGLLHSYQKIYEISCLAENWNGNGAPKFSTKILDSIRNIVENVALQPNIFPTARESIQLEYENDAGDYLEFELFEDGHLKKFYCSHDGKSVTENIPVEMIYEVVNKFYGFEI